MPDDYRPEKPPGLQAKWYVLGIDKYGSHHVANFAARRVYVVTAAGQLEHYHDLAAEGALFDDWMDHVGDVRGWDREKYGGSMLDGLVDGLEGAA